tara:strand:+ start:29265 stop:29498 length:234 start_codon:yes stop_codon:yes gene_type:complete
MTTTKSTYRLIGLDGTPHKVLDAPYESIDAAIGAAETWCNGQGLNGSLNDRSIGVEVKTNNGSWRTIYYQNTYSRKS